MKKRELVKIIVAATMLFLGMLAEHSVIDISGICADTGTFTENNIMLVWFLVAYIIIGGEVLREAAQNILRGQVFDENFLMAIASLGAFFVGEYPEALAVMLFYQIGELFQSYAVNRSRRSIAELMDIKPDVAYIKENDGKILKVHPEEVKIGQIIVVKPGEKVPIDGKVAKGRGTLDTSALTGESLPSEVEAGDEVISGSISVNGVLEIEVLKEFGQSTVSKILEMVENAGNKKAPTEKFITRFARYYTPIVVFLALALAVIPPVVEGVFIADGITGAIFSKWIYRALSFLVTSCPCALVISVPLSFFGGIGGAGSKGILVKGSSYLEMLAKCDTVVFDKTGTLTKGNFKVNNILPAEGEDKAHLLYVAALAEYYSNHPISESLKNELKTGNPKLYERMLEEISAKDIWDEYEEISGHGIKAKTSEGLVLAGNKRLLDREKVACDTVDQMGTIVYVAQEGKYLGAIVIADEVKEQSGEAIKALKGTGILRTVMLTGDKKRIGEYVGESLGLDEVYTELLPADKVSHVEEILKNTEGKVAFVGDGINDAPVLARADIGIAMGALGSDAAIEAADVVLMDDNPEGIAKAIRIAKKTVKIVKQNIAFALFVKILILILCAVGIVGMWAAVFADVGVSFIAILNALRAMRI